MGVAGGIAERIGRGEIVLLDGGVGSEVGAHGVSTAGPAWSAVANLEQPQVVQAVHEEFIRAGADVILTNTFSSGRMAMRRAGLEDRISEANRNAVAAARRAREVAERPVAIAGSISSFRTFEAHQQLQERNERVDVDDAETGAELLECYREQAILLAEAEVDLLALETMNSPTDGLAALDAAEETGLPIWLGLCPEYREDGEIGIWRIRRRPEDAVETFAELVVALVRPTVAAVNVMHCSLEVTSPALDQLREHWHGPIGAYPEHHARVPGWPSDETIGDWPVSDLPANAYLEVAREWVEHGAQIIGGCCGIRPTHIQALHRGLTAVGPR
jgi:S-methylmethionine-dependent homocysteine/selenocysteine methylase